MLGDAGHFGPGGCPRYGNAMTESRIYDPSPENEEYGFSFEHTAWTVAMQTSDRAIRDLMRALLTDQFPVLTEDLAIDALGAMIHFHPVHAVSEESWLDRVRQEVNYLLNFLEEPLLPDASRSGPQPWPLLNGYLQHRVGGYFNVVNYVSRQEALRWAEARIEDWSDEEKHSRHNFTVFNLGSGGEEDDRKDVFDLQCFLMEAGTRITQRRLRFHDMNANALLVQVVGEPDSSALVARSRPLGRWDSLDRFRRLLLGYDYTTGLRQRIADAHHELVSPQYVRQRSAGHKLTISRLMWRPSRMRTVMLWTTTWTATHRSGTMTRCTMTSVDGYWEGYQSFVWMQQSTRNQSAFAKGRITGC